MEHPKKTIICQNDKFLYFAYGAHMLSFRMYMYNLTPEFVSIARIENYRLDFIRYSKFWGGPTTTLVPTANAHVWGIIWRLKNDDMESLDRKKQIEEKKYYVKYLDVLTPHLGIVRCRTYIQKINPLPRGNNDAIPIEQWPSWSYKYIMVLGAKENNLPEYYIEMLNNLKDNGDEGCVRAHWLTRRYAQDLPCECRVPGRIPRRPLKLDLKPNISAKTKKSQRI